MIALPRAGEILRVGRSASVQFATPILFRVIRVLPIKTYEGWVWLDGYELNLAGTAVARREIFVQLGGLICTAEPRDRANRPLNRGPAPGPRRYPASPSTSTPQTRS